MTDHLTSFFPAGRDRGVTVAVEGFFAFVWFGWGQAAPPSWLVAPLAVGDGLAVLLTVAGVVLTTRSAGPLRVMADPGPPPPGGDRPQPCGLRAERGGEQVVGGGVVLGEQDQAVDVPLSQPDHARVGAVRGPGRGRCRGAVRAWAPPRDRLSRRADGPVCPARTVRHRFCRAARRRGRAARWL